MREKTNHSGQYEHFQKRKSKERRHKRERRKKKSRSSNVFDDSMLYN